MGQHTGVLGTRTWHVLHPFVVLAEQKGMTDPALRSSWTCCTNKSPLTLANLSIAQTWHWWLYTCTPFILYHPECNGFTIRYWELWAAVTYHPQEVCLSNPAGRPCGWQELRLPPGCADLEQQPSRALSWGSACSSSRGWGEQKWWWVSCAFLRPRVMARLYLDSHGCV